jgi:hypothetical protein
LDRVDEQKGAVGGGQASREVIELAAGGSARIALALNRLNEHGLNEEALRVGFGERGAKAVEVVGGDSQQVVAFLERTQVLSVLGQGRVRDLRGAIGAPVEGALQPDEYALA